jgi:predicted LPLAT superfamily acyltransferase
MNLVRRLIACGYAGFARVVACGFFCIPKKTRAGRRFYQAMFPERGAVIHLLCVFRQFQNFTTIHADRFRVSLGLEAAFLSDGLERLERALAEGRGAILLMSHLGNWEMAARILVRHIPNTRLLLFMGEKEREGVERAQKDSLRREGVAIIALGRDQDDPFPAIDGLRLLRAGGVVSMAGDVVWRRDQRAIEVDFFAGRLRLPEAPFAFALVSGAPIFAFFAFRAGANRYHFRLSPAIEVQAASRADRKVAMREAARRYAALLAEAVRSHPFEWYHFDA